MGDVLFYHLTGSPVEATLPVLLERSLARDWRVVIQSPNSDRLEALDRHLWSYKDDSFLPHGMASSEHSDPQPIVLSTTLEGQGDASVLMLLDGAWQEPDVLSRFERVCIFFDGNDPEAVDQSRENWTKLKEAGLTVNYWARENGSWVQKG